MRRNKCLLIGGLLLIGVIYAAFKRNFDASSSSSSISEELVRNKRGVAAPPTVLTSKLREGQLVCTGKKGVKPTPAVIFTSTIVEAVDELGNPVTVVSVKPQSSKPIGCCPPGDRTGKPYKAGYSCCVDSVFKTSTHFCCESKSRVLRDTPEEREFCRLTTCRLQDFRMERRKPMRVMCRRNRTTLTPSACRFQCPDGSKSKNDIRGARCIANGVWDQIPVCCEGCDTDYRLDLWIIVEVGKTASESVKVKRFLENMLSYFPISQDGVRVGITAFNDGVLSNGVWDLSAHDDLDSLVDAVYNLPFQGSGSNTGKALSWVADNAFTPQTGNRDVANVVVAILYGNPDDEFIEAARKLKEKAQVIAITIGKEISDGDLKLIAPDGFHRAADFDDLPAFHKTLYHHSCGEGNCI